MLWPPQRDFPMRNGVLQRSIAGRSVSKQFETIAGLLRRCEEGIVASIFIMSEPIRVAVTGAAGQIGIGYSLLFRIASGAVSHFHDL